MTEIEEILKSEIINIIHRVEYENKHDFTAEEIRNALLAVIEVGIGV